MKAYFVKPRPSILTTIHVLASKESGCSNERTYSYLAASSVERLQTMQHHLGLQSHEPAPPVAQLFAASALENGDPDGRSRTAIGGKKESTRMGKDQLTWN